MAFSVALVIFWRMCLIEVPLVEVGGRVAHKGGTCRSHAFLRVNMRAVLAIRVYLCTCTFVSRNGSGEYEVNCS